MSTAHETAFAEAAWDTLSAIHGQSVTYTPTGGSAVTRTGLFVEDRSSLEYGEDGRGEMGEATLTLRNDATTGVASPAYGDAVTVGGESWLVSAVSTSGATHRLLLRRWTADEKGGEFWRRQR